MHRTPLVVALLALALIATFAFREKGAAFAIAALIGGGAGFALYHASFGFTAAWRQAVRERRGGGLRAQMLLIGLTCLVAFPLLAWGGLIGLEARGYILPMGVSSAIGAFAFGIGMQLAGGCASGTLFTTGGGSVRMALVLVFFIAGSFFATMHWAFWTAPATPDAHPALAIAKSVLTARLNDNRGVSLIAEFGALGAMALTGAALAAIALISAIVERRAHGALAPSRTTKDLLRGPWSPRLGAVALALVGIGALLSLGQPWGVTSGFALWGAKIALALDFDVIASPYWSGWRVGQLQQSAFANGVSVMNFGIIAGAMAAAALAGKWAPAFTLSTRDIVTAIIGGLMMGYGARLAYGCNIGAYLGGLVSGSLHGWWWLIWGFAGSCVGTGLRARLSIDSPLAPGHA
ncbi:YeeE/YedE family protein [Pikeienuella piscinae]|uniref:YeeE/YedE family protein n=1 Tax=Pikeienuella piscinae TaxID=2748098 RepID=A0A7L5BX28_9RHOB|nr:YeeE/YedE family protein [Pikeienuella piscinae]QIE54796.1 YeeE/YedE family protein [Pikeienuella piscinae]